MGAVYSSAPQGGAKMEFPTFYNYFLYTKNFAYLMMFIVLPLYVVYWNVILYGRKKKK